VEELIALDAEVRAAFARGPIEGTFSGASS
jgi:hypothetical protein